MATICSQPQRLMAHKHTCTCTCVCVCVSAYLEQVKLNPALHVDSFVLPAAHLLALEAGVLHHRLNAPHPAKIGEQVHLDTHRHRPFYM